MKSKVSFKFDGGHNIESIKRVLKEAMPTCKVKIVSETKFLFRCYVGGDGISKETIFNHCYVIQCFCIFDDSYTF